MFKIKFLNLLFILIIIAGSLTLFFEICASATSTSDCILYLGNETIKLDPISNISLSPILVEFKSNGEIVKVYNPNMACTQNKE